MTAAGRKTVVLGPACPLREAIVERLARAGQVVVHLESEAAGLEQGAEILVHLDSSVVGAPGGQAGGSGPGNAVALVGHVERAAGPMESAGFGRIVHLRAAPDPAQPMASFEAAGTLALLRQAARRLAPVGITLNVITLAASDAVSAPPPATSSEVAALVEMLCDDLGGFVTAQCFSMVIGLG